MHLDGADPLIESKIRKAFADWASHYDKELLTFGYVNDSIWITPLFNIRSTDVSTADEIKEIMESIMKILSEYKDHTINIWYESDSLFNLDIYTYTDLEELE